MLSPTKRDNQEQLFNELLMKQEGASFVKYAMVEKNGQKVLVPSRYSIRNQQQI